MYHSLKLNTSELKDFLKNIIDTDHQIKYSVQYVDYADSDWTSPISLTEYRISQLIDDKSIIKISIVYTDGEVLILILE